MTRLAFLVAFVLVIGCGRPQEPLPAPVVETGASVEKEGERQSPPADPIIPARTTTDGGFRMGPYAGIARVRWDGLDRIEIVLGTGVGRVALSGDLPEILPLSEEDRRAAYDPWRYHESPDRTRVVVYGKTGPGRFIDRRTGQEHTLEAPGFYGSNMFDSWSPNGSYYLVQSVRDDRVPGFYFMDVNGRPRFQFHEPGYYSHRATWAPDGKHVAFLSVPLDTKYPTSPDGWEEQPFGSRVGLLAVPPRAARYASLGDGQVAFAYPVWSADGMKVAVTCGDLLIYQTTFSVPEWNGKLTTVRNSRICVIDAQTGTVHRLGKGDTPDMIIEPVTWSPDGTTLLVRIRKDGVPGERYALLPVEGGEAVPIPGKGIWIDGNRLAIVEEKGSAQTVHLVDRGGKLVRTLASGTRVGEVVPSPDHSHVAISLTARPGAPIEADYLLVLTLDQ